jgi:hypothetical protein
MISQEQNFLILQILPIKASETNMVKSKHAFDVAI